MSTKILEKRKITVDIVTRLCYCMYTELASESTRRAPAHRGGETTHDIRFIETEREILLSADGLICARFDTYGEAWKHAAWMHKAAGQEFTIEGQPAEEWFDEMDRRKLLDKRAYRIQEKG